jgi:hypothetical protein
MKQTEHQEQAIVIQWADLTGDVELALLHAIPNAARRSWALARTMKAEGLRSGVPDLCLPVPRRPYHGLYIEMKREGGSISGAQEGWIRALRARRYCVEICYSADDAIRSIKSYLNLPRWEE